VLGLLQVNKHSAGVAAPCCPSRLCQSSPLYYGRMAFVRSPDNISVELLQAGEAKAPAEPWASMENTGHW